MAIQKAFNMDASKLTLRKLFMHVLHLHAPTFEISFQKYLLLKYINFRVDPNRLIGLFIFLPFSSIAVTPFIFEQVCN